MCDWDRRLSPPQPFTNTVTDCCAVSYASIFFSFWLLLLSLNWIFRCEAPPTPVNLLICVCRFSCHMPSSLSDDEKNLIFFGAHKHKKIYFLLIIFFGYKHFRVFKRHHCLCLYIYKKSYPKVNLWGWWKITKLFFCLLKIQVMDGKKTS